MDNNIVSLIITYYRLEYENIFGNIKEGEMYIYNGDLYFKTNSFVVYADELANCVNMNTNDIIWMDDDKKVIELSR